MILWILLCLKTILPLVATTKPLGHLFYLQELSECAIKEEQLYTEINDQLNYFKLQLGSLQEYLISYENFIGFTDYERRLQDDMRGMLHRPNEFYSNSLKFSNKGLENVLQSIDNWPSLVALNSSMIGFLHVQEVHDFPLKNFSTALSGGKEVVELTAKQILDIGMFFLYKERYDMAIEWMEWSRSKVLEKDASATLSEVDKSLKLAIEVHNRAWNSLPETSLNLFVDKVFPGRKERVKRRTWYLEDTVGGTDEVSVEANFWALCGGQILQPVEEASSLFCRYDTKLHKFWLIGPLKVEQLAENLIQIHDILGNAEIQRILSREKLQRPDEEYIRVTTELAQEGARPDYVPELSRKALLITGLKGSGPTASDPFRKAEHLVGRSRMSTSQPHNDWEDKKYEGLGGNVVNTVLFYMEDVGVGGHTAFSNMRVRAPPLKGSAIFWFNQHRNGKFMDTVWHAACPVLYGRKISALKWLRYNAQFETYKCSLNPDE